VELVRLKAGAGLFWDEKFYLQFLMFLVLVICKLSFARILVMYWSL